MHKVTKDFESGVRFCLHALIEMRSFDKLSVEEFQSLKDGLRLKVAQLFVKENDNE